MNVQIGDLYFVDQPEGFHKTFQNKFFFIKEEYDGVKTCPKEGKGYRLHFFGDILTWRNPWQREIFIVKCKKINSKIGKLIT